MSKKKAEWPTRTKVLTYALGLSDADIVKLHRDLGKVIPKKSKPAKATT